MGISYRISAIKHFPNKHRPKISATPFGYPQ